MKLPLLLILFLSMPLMAARVAPPPCKPLTMAAVQAPARVVTPPSRDSNTLAAAPITMTTVKLLKWGEPHGVYMNSLRDKIIAAEAKGENAKKNKLMAEYKAWADKYLVEQ